MAHVYFLQDMELENDLINIFLLYCTKLQIDWARVQKLGPPSPKNKYRFKKKKISKGKPKENIQIKNDDKLFTLLYNVNSI